MRWTIFKNGGAWGHPVEMEMKMAKNAGIANPARLGDPHFDATIGTGVNWVISMGETIIVNTSRVTHGVAAGSRPILGGGETNIYRRDENVYELISYNHISGHYCPQGKLAYAIGLFHRRGIRFRSLSSRHSLD